MEGSRTIGLVFLILGASLGAVAQTETSSPQNNPTAPQSSSSGERSTAPAPAFGQNAPILSPENPPISGLDQPSLEMRTSSRSFIAPALVLSESADSNPNNQLGDQTLKSATEILGAFDLQRFWSKTDLFAEYLGGGVFYNGGRDDIRQVHALGAMWVTRWRTGQFTVRDSFSYLPDGTFGMGAYGVIPGIGLARIGGTAGIPSGGMGGVMFGSSNGSVGLSPRLTNLVIADIVQSLSPRSAFTIAGAYGTSHFFDQPSKTTATQISFIDSQQYTGEAGYSYMVGRRDQVAAVYGFQEFHFPLSSGGKVDAHIINLRWGHTISGRMSLLLGAGPEHISIFEPGMGTSGRWAGTALARFRYKFSRTSLTASYEKYNTTGSGFYAGAASQVARAAVMRPMGRTWTLYGEGGYSYHSRLQPFTGAGVPGDHYSEGFAGAAVRKQIGRSYGVFAAYHFNDLGFDSGFCGDVACNRTSQRHIGTVGVDWHPRPVRIE